MESETWTGAASAWSRGSRSRIYPGNSDDDLAARGFEAGKRDNKYKLPGRGAMTMKLPSPEERTVAATVPAASRS